MFTTSWTIANLSPRRNQQLPDSSPPPPVYILNIMLCRMEYSFGVFRSAVLTMVPPGSSCISSLAEQGKLKNPWLGVNTAQQQTKHQCVINIIPIVKLKHSTVPAAKEENELYPSWSQDIYEEQIANLLFLNIQELFRMVGQTVF